MRKLIFVLVMLLVPSISWAPPVERCLSSGLLSDEGTDNVHEVVSATPASLCGVIIETGGSNDATIIIYDSSSAASGNKLFEMVVTGGDNRGGAIFPYPIASLNGLVIDFAGTGTQSAIVYYTR